MSRTDLTDPAKISETSFLFVEPVDTMFFIFLNNTESFIENLLKVLKDLSIQDYMCVDRKKHAFATAIVHQNRKPKPSRVLFIENQNKFKPVYDITVADDHEFYANGILVHNCLGIRYGMGDWKLSKTLNIDIKEAAVIIDNYYKSFPKLKQKMDQYTEMALTKGYVKSKAGRIRHLPEAVQLYKEWGADILDMRAIYKKYGQYKGLLEDAKRIRRRLNNMINNALNFPIQSLAASIVSQSSIRLARAMKQRKMEAYICMSVHDEICVRCPVSEVDEVCKLMKPIMENTIILDAPLTADPQVGDTYGEVK
jgi:hypothetical protein